MYVEVTLLQYIAYATWNDACRSY